MRRLIAVLTAAAVTASGCSLFGGDGPGPADPARAFLAGWQGGDAAAAGAATDDPAAAQAAVTAFGQAVGGTGKLTLGEVTEQGDDAASAAFTAEWTLPAVGAPWRWDGTLPLVKAGDAWTVRWAPTDLHPGLTGAAAPKVTRELPERAALQDAAGQPLFTDEAVVTVGVEPRRATDLPGLAAKLAAVLKIAAADIVADVKKAEPDAFVPVITLRKAEYEQVKPQIYDLPGTVFQSGTRLLGPTARFAQPYLGRIGDATAEVLKEAGPGYAAGDQLGTSGLQRALNSRLAGKAGATVSVGGTRIAEIAGSPGQPVRTTLERDVQTAADAAVATQRTPTALVAVRPSTGAVVAVANNAAAPYDIALTGKFPPGSTFKIVTATALLGAGVVDAGTVVGCPGTLVVNGKEFENADQFDLGQVPFRTAFARSCNTTFTQLSGKLDDTHLTSAATYYGLTAKWALPVPFFRRLGAGAEGRHREGRGRDRAGSGRGQPAGDGADRRDRGQGVGALAVAAGRRVRHARRRRTGRAAGGRPAGAAGHDAGRGHLRHGHRAGRGAGRAGRRQDRDGGVRHGGAAAVARLVHRLPGRPGLRGLRPGRPVLRHHRRPGGRPFPDRPALSGPGRPLR